MVTYFLLLLFLTIRAEAQCRVVPGYPGCRVINSKPPAPASPASWDYTDPSSWTGLCHSGRAQSPIDIELADTVDIKIDDPLVFHDYNVKGRVSALNNGHTEMVQGFTSWTKQPSLTGGGLGARYILNQFHFHWSDDDRVGSEHTVDEAPYPLELHFVHIREDLNDTTAATTPASMAVVAVMFQVAKNATALRRLDNAFLGTVKNEQTQNVTWFTPQDLLPDDTSSFFLYNGSLTTPPCSEVVVWTLLTKPNHVTERQLNILRQHLEDSDTLLIHNFRPVQPLNGRTVYKVKTPRSGGKTVGISREHKEFT